MRDRRILRCQWLALGVAHVELANAFPEGVREVLFLDHAGIDTTPRGIGEQQATVRGMEIDAVGDGLDHCRQLGGTCLRCRVGPLLGSEQARTVQHIRRLPREKLHQQTFAWRRSMLVAETRDERSHHLTTQGHQWNAIERADAEETRQLVIGRKERVRLDIRHDDHDLPLIDQRRADRQVLDEPQHAVRQPDAGGG